MPDLAELLNDLDPQAGLVERSPRPARRQASQAPSTMAHRCRVSDCEPFQP